MGSSILWEDQWGEVIDRPEAGFVEIRWFDTTRDLDRSGFNSWLSRFAGSVEEARRPGILTDSSAFRMPMENLDGPWRDTHIIPRYNAAGVRRFAFLMPEGMPMIGQPPSAEGPAEFPTAYFGGRADAVAWLTE